MTFRVPLDEETPCALCGIADYELVSDRDRDGKPLRTTICRRCGLVWTNPRPGAEAVDEYYRDKYRLDYKGSRRPTPRKLLRGFLGAVERRRALLPVVRPGSRILDVGCGAGEFVYLMRTSGFDARGVEPDAAYGAFAREVLGIPIAVNPVGELTEPVESFDIVTMFHVLEHVADPIATLSRVSTHLKPSGLVMIEVPNVESVAQAPQHRFHFAHLFSFSPGTLTAIAARAGLTAVQCGLTADGGNIVGLFRKRRGSSSETGLPDLSGQYDRTMSILRGHTSTRHFLSHRPYARAVRRLLRRFRENRLLRRLSDERAILEWVKTGALEAPF